MKKWDDIEVSFLLFDLMYDQGKYHITYIFSINNNPINIDFPSFATQQKMY